MTFAAEVAEALGAEVTAVDVKGGQRLYLERGECSAKLDVYDDHVVWVSIQSPGGQGWIKAAHDMVRALFPEHGIKYLLASAGSKRAADTLARHGGWKPDGRYLRWSL